MRCWSNALSDDEETTAAAVADGARQALDGIIRLGGARLGDKTLVDSLIPFVETMTKDVEAGKSLAEAWSAAADASEKAAAATSALAPRIGRARPLAEKSIGHLDAGAFSLSMVAKLAGSFIATRCKS